MAKITEIEGIGESYGTKLEGAGIDTVEKLLEQGCEKKGRGEIAQKIGVQEAMVLKWVNKADLCRINGISTQYADLLEHAGVDTVPELAQRVPANLFAKMQEVNGAKNLVRQIPAESQVSSWVDQAKGLPRKINH